MVQESHDAKARLLQAAVRCFAEKGLDAVGIRELAQAAGVNSAAVSYHFGGKEGLYLAAVQAVMACGPAESVQTLPALPPAETQDARAAAVQGLKAHVKAFLDEIMECGSTEFGEWGQLLLAREMQQPHAAIEPFMREQMAPYVEHMGACLRILRPELDHEAIMRAGIGIHGQCLIYATHRGIVRMLLDFDPAAPGALQRLAAFIAEFSLRGLGVPESEIQGV